VKISRHVHRRLIALGAAVSAVLLGAASPQMPEGRIYVLHSKAAGGCPSLDWHIVVEANDILAGMISWDNMQTMARATGKVNRRTNTFSMTAVEMGGQARTAKIAGKIEGNGMLVASIEGPNVSCYSVIVRAFPAPRGAQ
jgi:hypothetical protein